MLVNYMAEAGGNIAEESLSSKDNGFSRDLLRKFVKEGNNFTSEFEGKFPDENVNGRKGAEEGEEELELSLGLSLNGRFGVDPERNKRTLLRSSSVSQFMLVGEGSGAPAAPITASLAPLVRTCSLPSETEEEWRKRKESQSLRRMEAKRRRLDKRKFMKGCNREDENFFEENGSYVIDSLDQGSVSDDGNGDPIGKPMSQRSIGSQGSGTGSSCLSEFESQPIKVNKSNEMRSPSSIQSKMQTKEKNLAVTTGTGNEKSATCIEADMRTKESKQMMKNAMLDMPCVSTIGNGPNGKKIDGFLYGFQKGEEVKIVCVCHGNFLSPAEFVKHAGGDEVEHPLRHIVVSPSPLV